VISSYVYRVGLTNMKYSYSSAVGLFSSGDRSSSCWSAPTMRPAPSASGPCGKEGIMGALFKAAATRSFRFFNYIVLAIIA
jgi:hypothetical protein